MRRIVVCGPPHSGKSVFLANLMRLLPPDSFYLAFAAPDGEWHWSNFGDQDLVAAVRQKGSFTEDFVSSMMECVTNNEQPLVLVDTGGKMLPPNEAIFSVCDGCIILSSKPEEIAQWRAFASQFGKPGFKVIAELDSVLVGTCELYPDQGDDIVRGRISGLERGHTIVSPTLEAVAERLREVIRANAEISEGEALCQVNGATLVSRLGVVDAHDPFLGVRPEHLRPALALTRAVAKLETVRIWNVRAAILASAYCARIPGSVELYDVSKGYIQIPDVTPQGEGFCPGVEWEVIPLPEFTVVKWKNTRFITVDDLVQLVPPEVDVTRPVVIINDGPPMWLHATLVRSYVRAGVSWVGQFWPVESGRAQAHLNNRRWDDIHPFAGPAVIVAGPDEKIGEMFPISFDLLRWGTPQLGQLASGELVLDRADSHVASHQSVGPILAELILRISSEGRESFCEQIDFDCEVGVSICVTTTLDGGGDEIIYAQRPNRRGLTRFVKNREPESTRSAVACFKRTTGGAYLLMTAFIGGRAPAEPWDRKWATAESLHFWRSHALIWDVEETIQGTKTMICPW